MTGAARERSGARFRTRARIAAAALGCSPNAALPQGSARGEARRGLRSLVIKFRRVLCVETEDARGQAGGVPGCGGILERGKRM